MPTAGNGNPSLGEIGRRLDKIESKIDGLNFVHPETFAMQMQLEQAHRENLQAQIVAIQNQIVQLQEASAAREQEAKANRRLAWSTLISPVLVGIALAILLGAMGR